MIGDKYEYDLANFLNVHIPSKYCTQKIRRIILLNKKKNFFS